MDLTLMSEILQPNGKTFNKYMKRVLDTKTPWTEIDIRYFRKYLKDHPEKYSLIMANFSHDYHITQEQTHKGINYIRNVCLRKDGELRQTKNMPFGQREAEIIKNFSEFRFVGLTDVGTFKSFYFPIYKVVATNGDYFEYSAGPQGQMEVVG